MESMSNLVESEMDQPSDGLRLLPSSSKTKSCGADEPIAFLDAARGEDQWRLASVLSLYKSGCDVFSLALFAKAVVKHGL
jgi:hypothetical protein